MPSLRTKRNCETSVDAAAKAELRAYVDQLPVHEQYAFVALATALIDTREMQKCPVRVGANARQAVGVAELSL